MPAGSAATLNICPRYKKMNPLWHQTTQKTMSSKPLGRMFGCACTCHKANHFDTPKPLKDSLGYCLSTIRISRLLSKVLVKGSAVEEPFTPFVSPVSSLNG